MFGYVVFQMLLWSVLFIMVFAFARVPLMQDGKHFTQLVQTAPEESESISDSAVYQPVKADKAWGMAWYHSVMSQTTLGCGDVQPVSTVGRLVTALQAATTLLVFGMVLLMALLFRKGSW